MTLPFQAKATVQVEVVQEDGLITTVTVTAPDFESLYDEIGAAASALTEAQAYTDSAIEALDATVSGESNGVQVEVVEANGVLSAITVTAPDFDGTYDELGAAASALTDAQAYTDSAITALDATVSGESNGVQVEIVEANGVLSAITVTAPDFDGNYDELGAADSALTEAQAYTDSAITALDATVSGSDSGVTVEVVEADGVVTTVNVETHVSEETGNALELKSDGLFAAIYYEDNDPVV